MSISPKNHSITAAQTDVDDPPSSATHPLIAYFRSGWAFFIPYLATYLLYAWLKWPVNAGGTSEGLVKGTGESGNGVGGLWSVAPLLHVYWFLHGLHLILGGVTLRIWWRNIQRPAINSQPTAWHRLYTVVPWLGLALIFWIPGTYLEWPADPWEHLRRITEWAIHPTTGTHSAGYKSFYFFAYSFLVNVDPIEQITRLDLYSTSISLLLAWQYYRLARTVGLDSRWAFISVLANVCLFGNVCFSFYRYYALGSSMYAQLGAVALTRIIFKAAKSPEFSLRSFFNVPSEGLNQTPTIYGLFFPFSLLLALIASNHIQGIGIAGLSIASIAVWRTLQGKLSRIWWIAGGVLALSIATYLWWPHHPIVDSAYRPGRWLNAWYGFNFAWPSPSADRVLQILGALGAVNLLAGIVLLRRNHVAGWLTVGPIIALALPFVSLPFANRLAGSGANEIITFHRMLFAIPSGLALAVYAKIQIEGDLTSKFGRLKRLGVAMLIIFLAGGLLGISPDRFSNNRLWNLLATTPQDLSLRPLLHVSNSTAVALRDIADSHLIAPKAIGNVLNIYAPTQFPLIGRGINQPVVNSLERGETFILSHKPSTERDHGTLNRDPLIKQQNAWNSTSPLKPEFINTITDFEPSTTALQNPAGQTLHLFSADLIPIDQAKSYRLEMSLRQSFGAESKVYLAVAWYDSAAALLPSNNPKPSGAGFPPGWANGTFSYFGLAGEFAPRAWTTYRITFGFNEQTTIPSNAQFLKLGALLNENSAPGAIVQLSNIRLWEKSPAELPRDGAFRQFKRSLVLIAGREFFFTPASQGSQLSHHWPAQQLAVDLAGGTEWMNATTAAGGIHVENNDHLFELRNTMRQK